MVALNTFLFSMGELWGRNADVHLFDQHVNAVTRFLAHEMQTATFPPSAKANATPVTAVLITPANGAPDHLDHFRPDCRQPDSLLARHVFAGSRLFAAGADNQGLYLLWQSRLETRFGTDPPRELLLTPLVTAMTSTTTTTRLRDGRPKRRCATAPLTSRWCRSACG